MGPGLREAASRVRAAAQLGGGKQRGVALGWPGERTRARAAAAEARRRVSAACCAHRLLLHASAIAQVFHARTHWLSGRACSARGAQPHVGWQRLRAAPTGSAGRCTTREGSWASTGAPTQARSSSGGSRRGAAATDVGGRSGGHHDPATRADALHRPQRPGRHYYAHPGLRWGAVARLGAAPAHGRGAGGAGRAQRRTRGSTAVVHSHTHPRAPRLRRRWPRSD